MTNLILKTVSNRGRVSIEYIAPKTELEFKITALFSSLIGRPDVGIYDDFYELGMDSLTATRFISQCKKNSIRLTFPLLFKSANIHDLCKSLEQIAQPSAVSVTLEGTEKGLI